MIAKTLKKHIKDSGETRYRISKETGIPESMLCRLMQGKGISEKNIDILCKYFNLELRPKE